MAGLELAQAQYVDFTCNAVVVVATLDAQYVAFPAVLVGCADTTITEAAVVALDDIGMNI